MFKGWSLTSTLSINSSSIGWAKFSEKISSRFLKKKKNPLSPKFKFSYPLGFQFVFLFILSLISFPSFGYERIVSLKPNLTEILFDLGVGDKIVGVTTFCDRPVEAKKIDKVSDYIQPDIEKIVAKSPDLILTSRENSSRREIEFLLHQGYRVLTFESDTLDQVKGTILLLGKELGREEKARKIISEMETSLVSLSVQNSKKENTKNTRVLFVVGHQPLIVAGSHNLFEDAARAWKVQNVAEKSALKYPTYSLEKLLTQAPDVILDFSMGSEASESSRKEMKDWWEKYPSIPAVKNHRVYFLDMGLMRAVPRVVEEWKKLYSEIFS